MKLRLICSAFPKFEELNFKGRKMREWEKSIPQQVSLHSLSTEHFAGYDGFTHQTPKRSKPPMIQPIYYFDHTSLLFDFDLANSYCC